MRSARTASTAPELHVGGGVSGVVSGVVFGVVAVVAASTLAACGIAPGDALDRTNDAGTSAEGEGAEGEGAEGEGAEGEGEGAGEGEGEGEGTAGEGEGGAGEGEGEGVVPDDVTRAANPGWIGGVCVSDADCAYAGGFCLSEGMPYGVCSLDCTLTCPDQTGAAFTGTFCVDGRPFGRDQGVCISRCDVDVYGASGCGTGYECGAHNRYAEPATDADACLPQGPVSACNNGDDLLVDLAYPDAGAVWIPREARCGGAFDLVVMMHGLHPSAVPVESLGGGRHLEYLVRDLIDEGRMRPVILAEPVSFQGSSTTLYGDDYTPMEHLTLVDGILNSNNLTLSSLSFIGHSGSGCDENNGLYEVLTDLDQLVPAFAPQFLLWGMEDNCYETAYHWEDPIAVLSGRDVTIVNMTTSGGDPTQYEANLLAPEESFTCDDTIYLHCLKKPSERWCSYLTDPAAGTTHDNNPYFFARQVFSDVFGPSGDHACEAP